MVFIDMYWLNVTEEPSDISSSAINVLHFVVFHRFSTDSRYDTNTTTGTLTLRDRKTEANIHEVNN